jgi:hypothetical protein
MRIREGNRDPGSARTAVDRRAVTAAGHLLMSAIWLEHRVRHVATRVIAPPNQGRSGAPAVRPLVVRNESWGDRP